MHARRTLLIVLPLVPNFYIHVFYERIVYIIVHALHVECLLSIKTCTYTIHLDINKHVLSFHIHYIPMKPAVKSRATHSNACKRIYVFLRYKWSDFPRYNNAIVHTSGMLCQETFILHHCRFLVRNETSEGNH